MQIERQWAKNRLAEEAEPALSFSREGVTLAIPARQTALNGDERRIFVELTRADIERLITGLRRRGEMPE